MNVSEHNLMDCKVSLIRGFPFLSFVVMSTKYIIVEDSETQPIKTMGATVLGSQPTVYVNERFLNEDLTTIQERAFVIAHEILHIFLLHLGRQVDMNYNHQVWNIATDYCINGYIVDMGSDKVEFPEFGGLLDQDKFRGKSSDVIYEELIKDAKEELGYDPDGQEGTQQGMDKVIADHGGMGEGGDNVWDDLGKGELTSEQQQQLKAQLSASLQNGKDRGDQKGNALIDALQELLEPTISWKELLAEYICKAPTDNQTYKKFNRRSTEIIFPCVDGDDFVDLTIGVDTSGSMSQNDLREALTEIKSITETFGSWKINLVACDTHVVPVGEYDNEEGDEFGDLSTAWAGGGGTDMNPIVEYAEEQDEPPHAVIIITDGYVGHIDGSYDIPVIVVVTSNGNDGFENNGCQVIQMTKD